MAKRTRHSFEFKKKIVDEFDAGVGTAQELGRKYGVHPISIYQWAKKLRSGEMIARATVLEKKQAKEIEYYKKKVAELTRDVDLLKKLQADTSQRQKKSVGLRVTNWKQALSKEPVK
jgi:transposase-like protein